MENPEGFICAVLVLRGQNINEKIVRDKTVEDEQLNKATRFLKFIEERRRAEQTYGQRQETKERRRLQIAELVHCYGITNRAAYLALSQHCWKTDEAVQSLKKFQRKKKEQRRVSEDRKEQPKKPRKRSHACNKATDCSNKLVPSEAILQQLELETMNSAATCLRVFRETDGDLSETRKRLLEHRQAARQRLARSEMKTRERLEREENVEKFAAVTGYPTEKSRNILEHFGWDYARALHQYGRYQARKGRGERLEVETSSSDSLMNDFRIQELAVEERRDLEQYFFSRETLVDIVRMFDQFDNPCCLVCPSVAHVCHCLNRDVTLLDIDERFSYLPRYIRYNLFQPSPLTQHFDLILFDPPFFQVPLKDLVNSVDVVAHNDTKTKLVVGFLRRSEVGLLKAFSRYGLYSSGYHPGYANVRESRRRNYQFYTNWDGLPRNSGRI